MGKHNGHVPGMVADLNQQRAFAHALAERQHETVRQTRLSIAMVASRLLAAEVARGCVLSAMDAEDVRHAARLALSLLDAVDEACNARGRQSQPADEAPPVALVKEGA